MRRGLVYACAVSLICLQLFLFYRQNKIDQVSLGKLEEVIEKRENELRNLRNLSSGSTRFRKYYAAFIPVLVLACNRVSMNRSLAHLIDYRSQYPNGPERFPIYVSQDCNDEAVLNLLKLYGKQLTILNQPDHSETAFQNINRNQIGYYKISRHYKWALGQIFDEKHYDLTIIVEDDLDVAPDFFYYFDALSTLLMEDRSLYCVSSWNDNGKLSLIDKSRNDLLYRSDFFPGLGWMMTRRLWDEELRSTWPVAYWDEFMRKKSVRRGRSCIRPEISRSHTFGRVGVSNGQFFDTHLRLNYLNEAPTLFNASLILENLIADAYDKGFLAEVYDKAVLLRNTDELAAPEKYIPAGKAGRLEYRTQPEFIAAARLIGAMQDFKEGVPRTAYRGVVSVFFRRRRIFLAPGGTRGWGNDEYPSWK